MSAETLRRAAALMRARAEVASEGRWFAVSGAVYTGTAAPHQTLAPCVTYYDDADHIASWDPVVALAVADAFDQHADVHDSYDCAHYGNSGGVEEPCAHMTAADAYLGGQP